MMLSRPVAFNASSCANSAASFGATFARNLTSMGGNARGLKSSRTTSASTPLSVNPFSSTLLGSRWARRYCQEVRQNIRNVAIIAHVDHGKTTLVDRLLTQSGTVKKLESERVMDNNQLEMERGITILAKYTSLNYNNYKINLLDTPGHGDFGGEVERILNMVDGVVLLVDAGEGVMAQTKFVLSKALKNRKKPIVVLNKIDRVKDERRFDEVESEIFELFDALEANQEQMEYPTLYASAREGWAVRSRSDAKTDLKPLFEAIVETVPAPVVNTKAPFTMLVSAIEGDPFLGRILTGRILSGKVAPGLPLHAITPEGKEIEAAKALKLVARSGLERVYMDEAAAGDIVGVAGFSTATVTATLCDPSITTPIPTTPIDPPVISMTFLPNTSPLSGKEGKQCTFPMIQKRLLKEIESNVSLVLKVDPSKKEAIEVAGRGELQLGILIENMRREGFEFAVSPPKVVYKHEEGQRLEPVEEVTIDVDDQFAGVVIEKLLGRKGEMIEMKPVAGKSRIRFMVPARALVGFRNELLTDTRGTAVYNHLFHSYVPHKGAMESYKKGALISLVDGETTHHALSLLEPRGILFVKPGTKVYMGMVIGEHSREDNLDVNPVRTKQLSNVRSVQKEEQIRLTPPKLMNLEEYIAYLRSDELLEVTPTSLRLRKEQLDPARRGRKSKPME